MYQFYHNTVKVLFFTVCNFHSRFPIHGSCFMHFPLCCQQRAQCLSWNLLLHLSICLSETLYTSHIIHLSSDIVYLSFHIVHLHLYLYIYIVFSQNVTMKMWELWSDAGPDLFWSWSYIHKIVLIPFFMVHDKTKNKQKNRHNYQTDYNYSMFLFIWTTSFHIHINILKVYLNIYGMLIFLFLLK